MAKRSRMSRSTSKKVYRNAAQKSHRFNFTRMFLQPGGVRA